MLNCDESITLYHKTYDKEKRIETYQHTVVHGCSWFVKTASEVTEKGMVYADNYTIRIPLENAPKELIFSKGDYVLKGEVIIENATANDLLKHTGDVFLITSYSVNDKGSPYTNHIRTSGS